MVEQEKRKQGREKSAKNDRQGFKVQTTLWNQVHTGACETGMGESWDSKYKKYLCKTQIWQCKVHLTEKLILKYWEVIDLSTNF